MTNQIPLKPSHPAVELTKSILLGLVLLAAGFAIGASAMFLHLSRKFLQRIEQPPIAAEMMLKRITEELHLTEQQKEKLKPILKHHFQQLENLRTQLRPQIFQLWQQMDKDIQDILTEPQRQRWQQRVQQFQQRMPMFRGPFPDQPPRQFRHDRNGRRARPPIDLLPEGQPVPPHPPYPPSVEPPLSPPAPTPPPPAEMPEEFHQP